MRIGIFLAYAPNVNLTTEGLGRYLGNLLKGFSEQKHEVTIACPVWMIRLLDDLFEDYQIDSEKINFIVSHKRPALWELYSTFFMRPKRKKSRIKLLYSLGEWIEAIVSSLASITSMTLLICVALLCAAIGIALLPVAALLALGFLLYKMLRAMKTKTVFRIKSLLPTVDKFFRIFTKKGLTLRALLADERNKKVQRALVQKINRVQGTRVDVWFSPSFFWPSFNDIDGVGVINAPDLVTSRFPELFAYDESFMHSTKSIRETISNGKYFITYCEYLRKTLVIDELHKAPEQVRAIAHSTNELIDYIKFIYSPKHELYQKEDFTETFCRSIVQLAAGASSLSTEYTSTMNFKDVQYIFYASQIRPHKNILTLIRAYEHLLRKKYCNIKLFLTGNPYEMKDIYEYLIRNRLQYDVLFFCGLTTQQLAAFYKCATVVVNPTLYEGGFPFTFGEGMSVGTPSIMSDIPQVREVIKEYNLQDCLFDPHDYLVLADKMEYAVKHKEELYKKQLPLFEDLQKRTVQMVANDYVEVFEYFIKMDRELN